MPQSIAWLYSSVKQFVSIDMELNIRPCNKEEIFKKFAVRFAQDDIYHTAVSFRPHESIFAVGIKRDSVRRLICVKCYCHI